MSYEDVVLAHAPLFYLPLTETAGSTFADASGNGHTGRLASYSTVTAGTAPGPISGQQAASFPDRNGELEFDPGSAFGTLNNFTLDYWVQFLESSDTYDLDFVFFGSSRFGVSLAEATDERAQLTFRWSPSEVQASSGEIVIPHLHCWHYYALTYDGTSVRWYRDGTLIATITDGSFASLTFSPAAGGAWLNSTSYGAVLNLTHTAFYGTALSAEDIAAIYAAATPRQDDECFRYRARLMQGDNRCWEHDRTTFRVYSDDVPVLETPFPNLGPIPEQILGKDPDDGLPKWAGAAFLARKVELPVDTGGQGQLPAADSTLPEDPPVPTTLQTDKPLPPVALPDPIVDNCPIMRCGAAYYLAQKLKEQYDIVRNCLLGMLAAPLLIRVPIVAGDFGIPILDLVIANLSGWLIGEFGADILWLTRIMVKLRRWMTIAGVSISVARDFEDIHEEGITILQRLAYPCLTCSENIFNLSQDMLVAWELAINADTADFTDWQRHLLIYILQATPFGIYHTVAAQGAAITSDTCSGF